MPGTATCRPPMHGNEGRAQGDFGLAEADIAADQAVHRARRNHVLDHGMDGGALVGGFLEAEIVGEDFVVLGRVAERVAFARGPAGVDVEQLGRGIADLFGRAALGFFPLARAESVQRRLVGADPRVAADLLQLAHRHVQHGLVRVFEVQELLHLGRAVVLQLAHAHVDQAAVAADAVGRVHHRVADVEFGQVLDQGFDIADLLLLLAPARGGAGGEQLGLGDEVDAFFQPAKAGVERGGGDAQFFFAGLEFPQRLESRRHQAAGAQEVEQALAPAIALGQQQHPVLACCGDGSSGGPADPRHRAPRPVLPASGTTWHRCHRLRPAGRRAGSRAGHGRWPGYRTARPPGTGSRAAAPGAPARPGPAGSARACPARNAGRPAPGRHAAPRWR